MAFPIIPKRRSGSAGNPTSLQLGELATNTATGELFLGGDGGVMLLNAPTSAGTTVTEHTGDGSTVAFTFTGYNGTADGGYLVSVGGIDQPPSKYSVSNTNGGTITFVDAPVNGELISIRAIVAGSGGGGGSGDATSLQGVGISTTAPNSSEALVYNGTEWAPARVNAVDIQSTNVSSTPPNPSDALVFNGSGWAPTPIDAVKIQGSNVSTIPPSTNGQALIWTDGEWVPSTVINATKIQGSVVKSTGPVLGQTLAFDADGEWAPSAVNATQIQGQSIDGTAPNESQVLKFTGGSWSPANENTNASQLNSYPISTTAPAAGNLLQYNGTEWAPFDGTAIPNWDSSKIYNPGEFVFYSGKIYICISSVQYVAPGQSAGQWAENIGVSSGQPTNTTTPGAWLKVQTPAAEGYIPIYQ